MNQIQRIFNYETNQVRTIIKDDQPWFVAKDICTVLDIKNTSDALKRLDEDEVTRFNLGSLSGETNIVNEAGLYSLILGSRKPEARQFKRWITHEVLPAIRKTGSYSVQQPIALEDLIIMQAQSVKELKTQVSTLGETVTTMQETFLQRDEDWRKSLNAMLNRAAFKLGGQYRDLRNKSYQLLEERGRCDLNKRLRNLLDRLEQNGATKTQIDRTSKMDVIEADARLKEIYTSIVKELSIGSMRITS